ncbi:hypothetical protein LI034_07655 [Clostridium perfringens]|uniref:Putative reticulocyte-binding protein n=1 Tax=Clostridium perfringens D str. JGS1721 TaxID=488537 RepID=B1V2W8_CLOPF|nr:hypothetical protein [Clostridium perfringens]WEV16120.1 hypothetical protein PL325_00250 [Clostridium perfringens D]AQW22412.1 hypothetical protein BXT91_00255 [Clostridium perfringens]EDT71813.1 putative reticulocyte-binding protein [Clostridium perfringens D str. JGS1721]ELC8390768.1 hypothetical protein [Clostridium perfringens]ELC8460546.1 hypothetical protein [Clostridium perfringens]
MSKKSQLLSLIKSYKDSQNKVYESIVEVNKNNELTLQGKEKRINEIVEQFTSKAINIHDNAMNLISGAIEDLQNKWRANSTGRLSDTGYQVGLANTISMIEKGVITDSEDFKNIIEVYKDDYNALATIRTLIDSDKVDLLTLIPKDNREYIKKSLNDLKNNIDNYISQYQIQNDMNLVFNGMINFIENRLRDDLSIISWEEMSNQ